MQVLSQVGSLICQFEINLLIQQINLRHRLHVPLRMDSYMLYQLQVHY